MNKRVLSLLLGMCVLPLFGQLSISATGHARLENVPVGRDSFFTTDIVGINNSGDTIEFSFTIVSSEGSRFFEPLPQKGWVSLSLKTSKSAPYSTTEPLGIFTNFPADSALYNKRFIASIHLAKKSSGAIAMEISLPMIVEMEPSRTIYSKTKGLSIAPSVIETGDSLDSLLVFNGSTKTETLSVRWAKNLHDLTNNESGFAIYRKLFLWKIPADFFVLGPGQREWIFFKKRFGYAGENGYIIFKMGKKDFYSSLK